MTASANLLFTPYKLGVIRLRNRVIRAAAFEGMCPGNSPSDELLNYHQSVGCRRSGYDHCGVCCS